MLKYRKKPVVIEAVQWDGTVEKATKVIDWVLAGGGTARYDDDPGGPHIAPHIAIDTLEGTMLARPGWWVIRDVEGEHYACHPDIFAAIYERDESSS